MTSMTKDVLERLVRAEMQRGAARVYAQAGRLTAAARLWQEQVRRRPDSFEARLELGMLYARIGKRQLALREYREARRLAGEAQSPILEPQDHPTVRCLLEPRTREAAKRIAELRALIAN